MSVSSADKHFTLCSQQFYSFTIDLVLPHVNWAQFQLTTDTSLRQRETVYFLNTWNFMSRAAEQLEKRINYLISYRLNITLLQKGQMSHSDHLQRAAAACDHRFWCRRITLILT